MNILDETIFQNKKFDRSLGGFDSRIRLFPSNSLPKTPKFDNGLQSLNFSEIKRDI